MLALRRSLRLVLTTVCSLTLLALPCKSTTWTVDATFGTGADFGQIKAALLAVSPGDTLLVKPGVYKGFTVLQAVKIIGDPGVFASHIKVDAVPGKVLIVSVDAAYLLVTDCPNTVIFDDVGIRFGQAPGSNEAAYVNSCADVRFVDCVLKGSNGSGNEPDAGGGLEVEASRVELTSCKVVGGDGSQTVCEWGGIAGRGVSVSWGSTFHGARSSIQGGRGGDTASSGCSGGNAAHGGHGLYSAWSGGFPSTVILAGLETDQVAGGDGGKGLFGSAYCGYGGDGIHISGGSLRRSGVTPVRGAAGCYGPSQGGLDGAGVYVSSGATQVIASPADPTLERLNKPVPGTPVTLQVNGAPGSTATLFLGRTPIVTNSPGVVGALLVGKMRIYNLGVIPASGSLTKSIQLPGGWPPGMLIVAQAECSYPGPELRRTNSVPLVLR